MDQFKTISLSLQEGEGQGEGTTLREAKRRPLTLILSPCEEGGEEMTI